MQFRCLRRRRLFFSPSGRIHYWPGAVAVLGCVLVIYALGTQAKQVPEPISSGDGPLLFLNLS